MDSLKIEPNVLSEWQQIANLVAKICNVPAALIMRKNIDSIEVMIASDHPDSPYCDNEKAPLDGVLYCEEVIKTHQPLHVKSALNEKKWQHNPDAELGMIFYFGVPINWPDGRVFGTFCIMGREEKSVSSEETLLIERFAKLIELTLALLISNEKLYQQSITDELTRVPNRRHFFSCLKKEFNRACRHNSTFCVAMMDLDNFKKINDLFGHDTGDAVLIDFARHLQSVIRAEDMLGRIGGEEFALVMPHTTLPKASVLLERIRCLVEESTSSVCQKVTFSAGLAEFDSKDTTADNLLGRADKLLYRAKQTGRNQICI